MKSTSAGIARILKPLRHAAQVKISAQSFKAAASILFLCLLAPKALYAELRWCMSVSL
jgi:hypothetical protein